MWITIAVIGGLVLVYVGSYILNKRTPVPEECLLDIDEANCNVCHNFSCSYKKED